MRDSDTTTAAGSAQYNHGTRASMRVVRNVHNPKPSSMAAATAVAGTIVPVAPAVSSNASRFSLFLLKYPPVETVHVLRYLTSERCARPGQFSRDIQGTICVLGKQQSVITRVPFTQKSPEISCITSTDLGTLVADIHGSVYLLNSDFETAKSWVAHSGGRVTHMMERNGILITLGVSYH